jgi:hypothetical protein
MTDEELLDFDYSRLASGLTAGQARELLAEHGEVYRAQLVAARFAEGWCERLLESGRMAEEAHNAYEHALRDMAAHMRQGDLLPGGVLYREEMQGS